MTTVPLNLTQITPSPFQSTPSTWSTPSNTSLPGHSPSRKSDPRSHHPCVMPSPVTPTTPTSSPGPSSATTITPCTRPPSTGRATPRTTPGPPPTRSRSATWCRAGVGRVSWSIGWCHPSVGMCVWSKGWNCENKACLDWLICVWFFYWRV